VVKEVLSRHLPREENHVRHQSGYQVSQPIGTEDLPNTNLDQKQRVLVSVQGAMTKNGMVSLLVVLLLIAFKVNTG
jgi:hypothetical protein